VESHARPAFSSYTNTIQIFYIPMTTLPSLTPMLLFNSGLSKAPLSPAKWKGHDVSRALIFSSCESDQLTGTAAVSSTFASRRNFAASSGGVGLI
jgi:hypothetical protein